MSEEDDASLKDVIGNASAFVDTSNSVDGDDDDRPPHATSPTDFANNSTRNGRGFYRGNLRIELPYSGSPPCTSPASPAEATTVTTNESPRTAVYRNSDGAAFHREMEECTLMLVAEQHARQSAMALLHADISSKAHLAQSMSRSSCLPPLQSVQPSTNLGMSGSVEMAEIPKKKTSLQQLFNVRTRKNRSTLSFSSQALIADASMHGREISTALDLTSDADQESHQHSPAVNSTSTPQPESGVSEPQLPPLLSSTRLAAPLSLMERLPGAASTSISPQPAISVPLPHTSSCAGATMIPPPSGAVDEDTETSTDTSGHNIGMEAVLRNASEVRGIRLTWLLYLLIIMVMVLFTLLLVQILYESNRTLVRTTTQAVRAQASVLLNSIDMEEFTIENIFMLMHVIGVDSFNSSGVSYAVVRETFCSRLYGAPMAFAMYNKTGNLVWSMRCSAYPLAIRNRVMPPTMMPSVNAVRITDYTWDSALAQQSFYSNANSSVETFAMLMDKNILGRAVMGNNISEYSSSTLQSVISAVLTRVWNGTEPHILFHTLTEDKKTYVATTTGALHDSLEELYHDICGADSPYVWHTVSHYPTSKRTLESGVQWLLSTTNAIPSPHLEYKRPWGQLSVANLCGVQCFGDANDTLCDVNNPTNLWFVVEYSLMRQNSLTSIVNAVGVVSIVALVIFSFVLFLVYISITVPVNFLRVQLLKTVGATDTQTNLQRKIVGWTYRLWLGDLTAIVRSTHILSLCFQLNKKYVPDHVLRNHARQLYLRRRKFNFLEDVDLKDEAADREDTGSESDSDRAIAPLPEASAAIPPNEGRFMWHFTSVDNADGAARQSEVEPVVFHDSHTGAMASPSTTAAPAVSAGAVRPTNGDASPPSAARGLDASGLSRPSKLTRRAVPHANDSATPLWITGDVDVSLSVGVGGGPDQEIPLAMGSLSNSHNAMTIRRDSESTILCVRIPSVELAYLLNYSTAVIQHRRIMRVLLHRIRRHKGALFHCSGDCLAAVWNAFEGCPNHAETAAICAQEIANAFVPFRVDGLHVGLVLHQGALVCGTVEYSKAAFVTVFGDGPREIFAIAELAATVGFFNIIITEPVKQSLSGLYDCNIVDVIQLPNSSHPLLLFELGSSRGSHSATPPTARAQFSIEYARVFSQFRNHEFREALEGIEHIRRSLSGPHHEHLLRRLERMCFFFAATPAALPYPYTRTFPYWVNYEAIAQAGLNDIHIPATERNNSFLSRSFMDGVVYMGVPTVRNEIEYIKDFKQELQENMRRTARRGNGSPTVDETSTHAHVTPQSSPPIWPTAEPTLISEERVMSVGSEMEMMTENAAVSNNICSSGPSPKLWHADPTDPKMETTTGTFSKLPAPIAANVAVVPSLSNLSNAVTVPLLTFDALHGSTTTEPIAMADSVSTEGSSIQTADSPRNVLALSTRFALTQRVTNQPPVALAEVLPEFAQLTEEHCATDSLTQHSGDGRRDHNTSNSNIQSAGMSFKCSVNNNLMLNGGGHDVGTNTNANMRSFDLSHNNLPTEIKAKSGTTYMRSTRILGKGSFGCVYLGMDVHSGRLVAIKFLPMPSDESGVEGIEAEVLILQRVNDTHVVQLLSYAFEGDTIVIIMECMLAGSLQNMISAFGSIPSSTSRVFMRDVLRGLSKIHSMGVIHRDMKPQNVLLSLAGNCKISDFGASAWLQELARKESQGHVCGTPVYLAPEAARGNPVKESDIWSCGIMFLQMITGTLPYSAEQLSAGAAALVFQIGSGIAQPRIPDNLDELDVEFVQACLQVDPSKRLTAAALLQLPIFTV